MKSLIQSQTVKYALAAVAIAIAAYILWDTVSNYLIELLSLGALGAGAAAANKLRAKEHQAAADEHRDMMDARIVEAAREIEQADKARDEIAELAGQIKKMPGEPKPGTVRKYFTVR